MRTAANDGNDFDEEGKSDGLTTLLAMASTAFLKTGICTNNIHNPL